MSEPDLASEQTSQVATLLDDPWVVLGIEYAVMAGVFLLTLIGGWILSGLLGRATARLVDRLGLEVLAEKLGAARLLYKVGVRGGVAKLSGKLARGLGLMLTFYVAIAQLRIEALTVAMSQAIGFLPSVLTAAAIAAGGVWLSDRLKRMVLGEEEPGGTRQFLAQAVSMATLVMAITMALEQLGVEMELLHSLLLGIYGVVACLTGVMFALGARASMQQFIAGHYGRKMLKVGDLIRLPDETHAYEVVGFGAMHIIAHKDMHHEALIPYTTLMTQRLRVMYSEAHSHEVSEEEMSEASPLVPGMVRKE